MGNLAAFNGKGESLWDRMLSGSVSQAPTLADLDEDGMLEIVCATASGDVIAVRGKDGKGVAPSTLFTYPHYMDRFSGLTDRCKSGLSRL